MLFFVSASAETTHTYPNPRGNGGHLLPDETANVSEELQLPVTEETILPDGTANVLEEDLSQPVTEEVSVQVEPHRYSATIMSAIQRIALWVLAIVIAAVCVGVLFKECSVCRDHAYCVSGAVISVIHGVLFVVKFPKPAFHDVKVWFSRSVDDDGTI